MPIQQDSSRSRGEEQHGARMTVRVSATETPVAALDGTASAIASARRAVLADRYPVNSLTVEWRIFTELASIVPEWRKLAACALEPNVFYEPAFALAAAPAFAPDAGALLVWSATSPRRLLGFFPARVEKRRYGFNLPLLIGLTHPYGPLGVPLVEREAAEPVIAAWLAHLAADAALPGLVLLPFLTENGAFAAALEPILRRAQMPFADFDRHQRALLAPSGERSLYVEHALSHHRRKELRRQWRRLSEAGARGAQRRRRCRRGRRRDRSFSCARSGRLERPRRHGGGRRSKSAALRAQGGQRAGGGRQSHHRSFVR